MHKMSSLLPGQTVEELIHHWDKTDPETEAFVSLTPATLERRALTRGEVNDLARKFASRLRQEGVGKGEVVCVALSNCLERVVVDFGVICSGAVALNGQAFRSDGQDLIQALNSTKAKAIVVDTEAPQGAWSVLKDHLGTQREDSEDVSSPSLPDLRRVITCQRSDDPALDFFTKLRNYKWSLQRARALPKDRAVIWATSGSTGYSKLVPQSHANLTHIARQVLHISGLGSGDRFLNCAPLGWAGGFPLWFLSSGVTRVFVDLSGGPVADMASLLWRVVQKERPRYVFTTPMFVSSVLEQPALWRGELNMWSPEGICVAGQPMKRTLITSALQLCSHVDINYGTTECGVIATTRVTTGSSSSYEDGMTGPPALGVDVRIVDDALQDVPSGETGEIMARSPALFGLYVGDQQATEKAFTKDGWFKTDDVGFFHAENNQIVHLGRRSDAITRGAYICYPVWLESLLRQAPNVRDVCVVPVPDPVLHHEICACVVPTPKECKADEMEAALRTFADSLLLTQTGDAQHMAPRYYVMLSALPLTPNGKISRKDARDLALKQLGWSSD